MRPGRLYIKIFLAFVGVLIITDIVIFGMFMVTAGRSFRDRYHQVTSAKIQVAKKFVEDRAAAEPGIPLAENQSVARLLTFLSRTNDAWFWLTDFQGKLLAGTPLDRVEETLPSVLKDYPEGIRVVPLPHRNPHGYGMYAGAPVNLGSGKRAYLNAVFVEQRMDNPHGAFAMGLGFVSLVIAILIIPVSRLISRPVNKLSRSALRIADGDLSHRAELKTKDEIGDLGRAFNLMADRLAGMIKASKELTAHVSHEMRSPLARIRVAEELIRDALDQGDQARAARYLDGIQQEIEDMDRLVGRILELSRLDLKGTPPKKEKLNVSALIEEALTRFGPAFQRRGLRVLTSLGSAPALAGDPEALQTALANVLDNAAKYTPEGGLVNVRTEAEPGGLVIAVANTFETLNEEDLSRIFEPFQRTEQVESDGTGLGLAITKKIVENHGGSIEAVNGREGFEVRMHLPFEG